MKELKATDLMVGDIVMYNNKPIKVENIHDNMINYTPDIPYVQEEYFIELDKISPITLTTEILEKIGFVQDSWISGCWVYKKDKLIIKIQYPNDYFVGSCIIDVPKGSFMNYVFSKELYIHELQHCLRICGLNELADNLKME